MALLMRAALLHLALAPPALGLRRATAPLPAAPGDAAGQQPARAQPRTAILLVGMMTGWEDHIDDFLHGMVLPNQADVFIHTEGLPKELVERLGGSLKAAVDAPASLDRKPFKQFYHLEKAFELMAQHEAKEHFRYDVVVRARSDSVPAPPSQLNLSEWRAEGGDRMYMMTDRIFWSRRENMATACAFWSALHNYYMGESPDPWNRTIPVWRFWDTIRRDPFVTRPTRNHFESWKLYQKLTALPYPYILNTSFHYRNLRTAVERGMITWSPAEDPNGTKSLSFGSVVKVKGGKPFNVKDYQLANPQVEKDLLHWIMLHNITICDIGPSMRWLKVKGRLISRNLSSDCSIKPFEAIDRNWA
mmetsp:Transcript_47739/g.147176  ORF Transcript_47739/g.147176 Transcript_47739/m.147176 type:complete len:360 (-) Transcript_47739:38-1117(-)